MSQKSANQVNNIIANLQQVKIVQFCKALCKTELMLHTIKAQKVNKNMLPPRIEDRGIQTTRKVLSSLIGKPKPYFILRKPTSQ